MCKGLKNIDYTSLVTCKKDDTVIIDGWLKKELCDEFESEEWSKSYTDMNELFYDLGLND